MTKQLIPICLALSLALLHCVDATAQKRPDPRLRVMQTALRRGTAAVRFQAIRSILKLKGRTLKQRLVPLLAERLADKHPLIRIEALKTLGKLIKLPAASRALIGALKHNSLSMRYLAAQTLGKEGVTAALGPLEKLLLDRSPSVRREAMTAISKLLQKIDKQRQSLASAA